MSTDWKTGRKKRTETALLFELNAISILFLKIFMWEKVLLAISPEDKDLILEFTGLIFGKDEMKAASLKPEPLKHMGDKIRQLDKRWPGFEGLQMVGQWTGHPAYVQG